MRRLGGPARVAAILVAALAINTAVLISVGVDPVVYYRIVLEHGVLSWRGVQETVVRTAPLMLLSASLMVAFSAGLWNLGLDGQYLVAALTAAVVASPANAAFGRAPALLLAIAASCVTGAAWALLPAMLRAARGLNEIISSLIMNYLAISLASALIKLVFADRATTVPQTLTLPVADRLPRLFGTIHLGVPLAAATLLAVHVVLTRSAWGLRLRTIGASERAARHAGIDVARTSLVAFLVSGALAGAAGGVDMVGVWGNARADWHPAYGLTVIPLVLLARFDGWAIAALVLVIGALSVGEDSASVRLGVPSYFGLFFLAVALLLVALGQRFARP